LGEATRFARWLTPADRDADDVIQETVARVLASKQGPEPSRVKPWLLRIVRNVCIDARRSHASRERLIVFEGGLEELSEVELLAPTNAPSWDRQDLEAVLAELPESARSALLLSDLWGLDQDEIAEVLEIPAGTVKSRVARARARAALLLSRRDGVGRATKRRP
jgi:RNA polymerase sigma-70 factor (ECF subfamily)